MYVFSTGFETQQPDTGTIITFGGYGRVWTKGRLVRKKRRKHLHGKFNLVSGLAFSSTNEIFVADKWNRRIQVFSMKGVFLRSFDTGNKKPRDIAMDQTDTLWVLLTDVPKNILRRSNKNSINRYSKEGRVLEKFMCAAPLSFTDKFALDTLSDDIIMIRRVKKAKVKKSGSAGRFNKDSCTLQPFRPEELMLMKWPSNVAVDKEGNIYITEEQNHKVLTYDKNGTYIGCFGCKGDESSNHLNSPVGICVDSLGRIIVADKDNNRVEMFTAEGEYIRTIANIKRPKRVAIGREGQLVECHMTSSVSTSELQFWQIYWRPGGSPAKKLPVIEPCGKGAILAVKQAQKQRSSCDAPASGNSEINWLHTSGK
ncbi:hypothetical protein Bbelb_309780 [Branchiostoma belcheri]|nr:hypothetical protein Bbelb_309780 [Branchiostoma belcheri]